MGIHSRRSSSLSTRRLSKSGWRREKRRRTSDMSRPGRAPLGMIVMSGTSASGRRRHGEDGIIIYIPVYCCIIICSQLIISSGSAMSSAIANAEQRSGQFAFVWEVWSVHLRPPKACCCCYVVSSCLLVLCMCVCV
jgi:hypothetical protein